MGGGDTAPPPAEGRVRTRPSRARVNMVLLLFYRPYISETSTLISAPFSSTCTGHGSVTAAMSGLNFVRFESKTRIITEKPRGHLAPTPCTGEG